MTKVAPTDDPLTTFEGDDEERVDLQVLKIWPPSPVGDWRTQLALCRDGKTFATVREDRFFRRILGGPDVVEPDEN